MHILRQLLPVDVRQTMANGGGPACLRLRVVADPATVDPRFMATADKLDRISEVVTRHWPEAIASADLASPALVADVRRARSALRDSHPIRIPSALLGLLAQIPDCPTECPPDEPPAPMPARFADGEPQDRRKRR